MGIVDPVQERTDADDAARLSQALDQATRRVVGTLLAAPPPVDFAPPRIDPGMERTFVTRQQEADQLADELHRSPPGHREQPVHGNRGGRTTDPGVFTGPVI